MIKGGLAEAMVLISENPFRIGTAVRMKGDPEVGEVIDQKITEHNVIRVLVRWSGRFPSWAPAEWLEVVS